MKKIIALAGMLLLNSFCTMAQESQITQEQKGRLSKVKKQLDESWNRFKRCLKREGCTRQEKLKVARDVVVAASAVIVAMYGVGAGLRSLGEYVRKKGSKEGGKEGDSRRSAHGVEAQESVPATIEEAQRVLPVGTELVVPVLLVENFGKKARVVDHELGQDITGKDTVKIKLSVTTPSPQNLSLTVSLPFYRVKDWERVRKASKTLAQGATAAL